MASRSTPEERAQVVALAVEVGVAEAARQTGVPVNTVGVWVHRAGMGGQHIERIRPAVEARKLTIDARKQALADRMLGHAERILGQLDEPHVERSVKVVAIGGGAGSEVEIVDVNYDRPPTADQKRIVDAVAVLVDKVQLLTGEATSRPEVLGGEQPVERTQLTGVVDQLAERRVA